LGIAVSATSVRKVLLEEGLQPAPQRSRSSWRMFLRAHAASMLACDFLTVETAFLQRIYVLFFISLVTRRIEYIASTSNPDGRWVTHPAHLSQAQQALDDIDPRDYDLDAIAFVVRALPEGLAAILTVADDTTLTSAQVEAMVGTRETRRWA
jgi:hypothetical protein